MNSNRKTVVGKLVRKAFGNLEIVDAKEPLLLIPKEVDFQDAVRKDPRNCGLSRCVSRMFNASLALFFKNRAYVDIVGKDGIRRSNRFVFGKNVLSQIAAFDRGDPLTFGRSIVLRPPPPKSTLAGERRRNRRWQRSDVGKALTAERKMQSALRVATGAAERAQEQYEIAKNKESASSPKLKVARRQLDVARTKLREVREQAAVATVLAKELRTRSFSPKPAPKPRHYDLTVRNATGFFSRGSASGVA